MAGGPWFFCLKHNTVETAGRLRGAAPAGAVRDP